MRYVTFSSFGFTMIELLVATTILALLATIGIVSYTASSAKARDGKRKADLSQVRTALEMYRSQPPLLTYPSDETWDGMITTLNGASYLSVPSMYDPQNDAPYVYSYTPSADNKSYSLCANFETSTQDGMTCSGTAKPFSCCFENP